MDAQRGMTRFQSPADVKQRLAAVDYLADEDVAVTDSLSGRLEYIPGSAQADRDAVFTTEPNEAGSVVLRWEISGRLLPGEEPS